jgi:ferrochelatase
MTFENFSRVTHAALLNEPFVSSFYDIVFDAAKVKRGDLFVSNDPQNIKEALERGAYAILSDTKVVIRDEEIAWLRCKSIDEALIGLLRYKLMEDEREFFYFDKTSVELMQKITHKPPLLYLSGDIKKDFQKLYHNSETSIVIGSDETLLQKIYPAYQTLDKSATEEIKPYKSTLFTSTFYLHGERFENIKLPPLFLPRLSLIIAFLQTKEIAYNLHKCDFTPSLYPIFINKNLEPQPFGSTPSTIVLTEHEALFEEIVSYIHTKAPWAATCTLCKSDAPCPKLGKTIRYQNLSEIKKLKEIEFNFAIIEGDLQKLLLTLKNLQTKEQLSLF